MQLFSIKSFLTLVFGLVLGIMFNSSIAENAASIKVFSEHEKELHEQRMKNMTEQERNVYRDQQYQILRQRAAAIGYSMPELPPWAEQESDESKTSDNGVLYADQSAHEKQLQAYRQDAADKRKAMHERIEQQRQAIKKRIDNLVEKNTVKATKPVVPVMPTYQPVPMRPPMTPMPPPNHPGYRMMPPMPFYRY